MYLAFSPAELGTRDAIRAFLAEVLPPEGRPRRWVDLPQSEGERCDLECPRHHCATLGRASPPHCLAAGTMLIGWVIARRRAAKVWKKVEVEAERREDPARVRDGPLRAGPNTAPELSRGK